MAGASGLASGGTGGPLRILQQDAFTREVLYLFECRFKVINVLKFKHIHTVRVGLLKSCVLLVIEQIC